MSTFTNQAQLFYNNQTTKSNLAVGELVSILTATKTALNTNYKRNDCITYVITLVNSDTNPIQNIVLEDDLCARVVGADTVHSLDYRSDSLSFHINGIPQQPLTITSEEPLTITSLNLPASGNATIIYEALITDYAPLDTGSSITNTVTIQAPDISPFSITCNVPVSNSPELTVTKSITPVPVIENDTLTYTFLIQNYGNAEAGAGDLVYLSDEFDPLLNTVSATLNESVFTNYVYDEQTGLFKTNPGSIIVPAATFETDPTTGICCVTPGAVTLSVSGII